MLDLDEQGDAGHGDAAITGATPGHHCHDVNPGGDRSWAAMRLLGAIRWYQRGAEGRPSPCRFFPSCSEYAVGAIETHGAGRGGWLTIRRLLRCRPLGPSGFDPVPEPSPDLKADR